MISIDKQIAHWLTSAYVISFPKCGRTWLRVLIGKAIGEHYGFKTELINISRYALKRWEIPVIRFTHDTGRQFKTVEEMAADSDYQRYGGKKVVLLVRDPRDTIVSNYFQKTKRKGTYEGDIKSFIREERGGLKSLIAYYNYWLRSRDSFKGFHLVRYEDLHRDAAGELAKIFDFLELPVSQEAILQAVEFSRFENMKKMEQKGSVDSNILKPKDPNDQESYKVRKGKVGGYREYLDEEDIAFVEGYTQEHLSDQLACYKTASDA